MKENKNTTKNTNLAKNKNSTDNDIKPWELENSQSIFNVKGGLQLSQELIVKKIIPQKSPYKIITKVNIKESNFCENLRKYQQLKAFELKNTSKINFIQKNKKQINEQNELFEKSLINSSTIYESKIYQEMQGIIPMIQSDQNNLFEKTNIKSIKQEKQKLLKTKIPIQLSLLMYFDQNGSNNFRSKHLNVSKIMKQHERNFSQIVDRKICSSLRNNVIQEKSGKCLKRDKSEHSEQSKSSSQREPTDHSDNFQKMLKLKESIRRKNLKSASKSRKIDDSQTNYESELRISQRKAKGNNLSALNRTKEINQRQIKTSEEWRTKRIKQLQQNKLVIESIDPELLSENNPKKQYKSAVYSSYYQNRDLIQKNNYKKIKVYNFHSTK